MEGDYLRRGTAEFVGAFALTFVGAAAVMLSGAGGLVGIAFAHGLVIAVMASAVGHISGGHFNPAVTFGFLLARRMAPPLAVCYWIAQLAGAAIAALLLWWAFPAEAISPARLGAPQLHPLIGQEAGFVLEAIGTFFLVWVIFATTADERGSFRAIAGLAIGLTITLNVLAFGPFTGAALNPSRAFGPELVHNVWESYTWIYYAGPLVGGALAALAYEWLYLRRPGWLRLPAPRREPAPPA